MVGGIGSIIYYVSKRNKFDQSTITNSISQSSRSINTLDTFNDSSNYNNIEPDTIGRGIILCSSCGTVNPYDSIFCMECGTKV